jgi:peptidoglycan hydrolase FlgJ
MTAPVAHPSIYTDPKGLTELKRGAKEQDPQALREAARQFESLFARMMLKSMREASFGDPLLGSDSQDFYQGMFDDQFALEMTKGRGLGLADMLVQQLARAGLAAPETDAAKNVLNPLSMPGQASAEKALAMLGKSSAPASVAASSTIDTVTDEVAAAIAAAADLPVAAASPHAPETNIAWPPASREDFVRQLWPMAEKAGRELGIDPKHILAQAALETGWGRSVPSDVEGRSSFNLFGIKTGKQWNGAAVAVRTLEFENGVPTPRRERFRAYASPQECFNDYVALLRDNPRYASVLNSGSDANAFANGLQRSGYATDPAYARKVAAIAQNMSNANPALKSVAGRPMTTRTEPL